MICGKANTRGPAPFDPAIRYCSSLLAAKNGTGPSGALLITTDQLRFDWLDLDYEP